MDLILINNSLIALYTRFSILQKLKTFRIVIQKDNLAIAKRIPYPIKVTRIKATIK